MRKEHLVHYENALSYRNGGVPRVSAHCLNETNTIKHCLRNKNLSVLTNAKTWENECATQGFYRHCIGK